VSVFMKKPVLVEGIQWTTNNIRKVGEFLGGRKTYKSDGEMLVIDGDMIVMKGDWLLKDKHDDLMICSDKFFNRNYVRI
jgi:hypothetical protein